VAANLLLWCTAVESSVTLCVCVYRFIECKECGRAVHRICVLYLEHLWPSGFMCDNCRARNGVKRSDNKFVAKRKLASHRVSSYLKYSY